MKKTVFGMAACAAILAACTSGSGGGSGPSATETPVPPTPMAYTVPPVISAEQLGAMTLALADFGPKYTTFDTLVDTPLTLVIERAVDACDAAKEQTALSKYGWSNGYVRWFGTAADGFLPAQIGTNIDVYSSADNASTKIKYDTKQIRQDQLAPGGCNGAGIEHIEELGLPTVGDQSWAVRIDFSVDHVRGSQHMLVFRRDRIVATVSIVRFNAEDSSIELADLARKVDERLLKIITAPLTSAEPSDADAEI